MVFNKGGEISEDIFIFAPSLLGSHQLNLLVYKVVVFWDNKMKMPFEICYLWSGRPPTYSVS